MMYVLKIEKERQKSSAEVLNQLGPAFADQPREDRVRLLSYHSKELPPLDPALQPCERDVHFLCFCVAYKLQRYLAERREQDLSRFESRIDPMLLVADLLNMTQSKYQILASDPEVTICLARNCYNPDIPYWSDSTTSSSLRYQVLRTIGNCPKSEDLSAAAPEGPFLVVGSLISADATYVERVDCMEDIKSEKEILQELVRPEKAMRLLQSRSAAGTSSWRSGWRILWWPIWFRFSKRIDEHKRVYNRSQ